MSWGGRRAGAGRPRKEVSSIRPTHSIRASREEWAIIKPFADIVKMGYGFDLDTIIRRGLEKMDEKYPPEEENEKTFVELYVNEHFRIKYGDD